MIPRCDRCEDGLIRIPLLSTKDAIIVKEISIEKCCYGTLRANICLDEALQDDKYDMDKTVLFHIYEVVSLPRSEKYLVISFHAWDLLDDPHAVALPYNYMNLVKFYKDYVMTFSELNRAR